MRSSGLASCMCLVLGILGAGCGLDTLGTGGDATRPDGARLDAGRIDARVVPFDGPAVIDGGGLDAGAPDDAAVPSDGCVLTGLPTDVCNGVDDDCDGMVDEDDSIRACGVGMHCRNRCVAGAFAAACENVDVPGSPEVCTNGDDDNCDGTIDEMCECTPGMTRACGTCSDGSQSCPAGMWGMCTGDTSPTAYYRDADADGYGTAESMLLCSPMAGWVTTTDRDCDDTCVTCSPVGTEVCDGRDNDCDGTPDDGVGTLWYRDADGDGFGTMTGITACASPGAGWLTTSGDCDDACARCRPGYPSELCLDGRDNNCNGATDEAGCPCDLLALATGTYLYCRSQTWSGGRTTCALYGGDLAIVGSAAENNAIFAAVTGYGVRSWLGAGDARVEGTWEWHDGTRMSTCVGSTCTCAAGAFCAWRAGQPSSAPDNCLIGVVPGWVPTGQWGDYPCGSVESAVCELP